VEEVIQQLSSTANLMPQITGEHDSSGLDQSSAQPLVSSSNLTPSLIFFLITL
jgi:hypothetical protein